MKVVVQRVRNASVAVDSKIVGQIDQGMLVYLGVMQGDTEEQVHYLVKKLVGLRIFQDSAGKMNLSLTDTQGQMLIVSQFTLAANCKKGKRPSFDSAAPPDMARVLYQKFIQYVSTQGIPVESGIFGAFMQVSYVNDGPVTFIIEK